MSWLAVNGKIVRGPGLVGVTSGMAPGTLAYSSVLSTSPSRPLLPPPNVDGNAWALDLNYFLSFFNCA